MYSQRCAALLNRLHELDAALRACDRARAVLRPIDQLMEDEDPPASLLLESAGLGRAAADAGSRRLHRCSPQVDPRCMSASRTNLTSPVLAKLHRGLRELCSEVPAALSDPGPAYRSHEAAAPACAPPERLGAFHPVAGFFRRGLSIVGCWPTVLPPSMVMALSSVEAQLDVLADKWEVAAHAPLVNAAIAAMAEAMGLSRGILPRA